MYPREKIMFFLPYIAGIFFLIALFLLFVLNWEGAKVLLFLCGLGVFLFELFIAACIHLVTWHIVTANFTRLHVLALAPVLFLGIVWTVHYFQLRPERQ